MLTSTNLQPLIASDLRHIQNVLALTDRDLLTEDLEIVKKPRCGCFLGRKAKIIQNQCSLEKASKNLVECIQRVVADSLTDNAPETQEVCEKAIEKFNSLVQQVNERHAKRGIKAHKIEFIPKDFILSEKKALEAIVDDIQLAVRQQEVPPLDDDSFIDGIDGTLISIDPEPTIETMRQISARMPNYHLSEKDLRNVFSFVKANLDPDTYWKFKEDGDGKARSVICGIMNVLTPEQAVRLCEICWEKDGGAHHGEFFSDVPPLHWYFESKLREYKNIDELILSFKKVPHYSVLHRLEINPLPLVDKLVQEKVPQLLKESLQQMFEEQLQSLKTKATKQEPEQPVRQMKARRTFSCPSAPKIGPLFTRLFSYCRREKAKSGFLVEH